MTGKKKKKKKETFLRSVYCLVIATGMYSIDDVLHTSLLSPLNFTIIDNY